MTDNSNIAKHTDKITERTLNYFLCEWESAVKTIYGGRPEEQAILDNLADAKRHLENHEVREMFHSFGEAYMIVQGTKP